MSANSKSELKIGSIFFQTMHETYQEKISWQHTSSLYSVNYDINLRSVQGIDCQLIELMNICNLLDIATEKKCPHCSLHVSTPAISLSSLKPVLW